MKFTFDVAKNGEVSAVRTCPDICIGKLVFDTLPAALFARETYRIAADLDSMTDADLRKLTTHTLSRLSDIGLSHRKIGHMLGVSGSAVSQWSAGRTIPPLTALAWLEALLSTMEFIQSSAKECGGR